MNIPFASAKGHPGLHRTHLELFDGEAYMVTHTATRQAVAAIENGRARDVDELVFANGSFTSRKVLEPLVEGVVALAEQSGRKLEVTTYDDPLTGSRAYGQAYRTERYAHVINHLLRHRRLDTDHPISFAGQSRGWLTIMGMVPDLQGKQELGRLTGMAPVGHTPREIDINTHDVLHVLGMTFGELTDKHANQKDRHALAVKFGILGNAIRHTAGNALAVGDFNPLHMIHNASYPLFQEVQEILTTDVTDVAVEASQHAGALTLLAWEDDRDAPGRRIQERFAGIPEFAGSVVLMDTAHNGSLLDKELVPELYGHLTGYAAPVEMLQPAIDKANLGLVS